MTHGTDQFKKPKNGFSLEFLGIIPVFWLRYVSGPLPTIGVRYPEIPHVFRPIEIYGRAILKEGGGYKISPSRSHFFIQLDQGICYLRLGRKDNKR